MAVIIEYTIGGEAGGALSRRRNVLLSFTHRIIYRRPFSMVLPYKPSTRSIYKDKHSGG